MLSSPAKTPRACASRSQSWADGGQLNRAFSPVRGPALKIGGGGGGGDAKSIRSRHYHGVGLARVAVRIKTVVVGWSEVVTMADTPTVSRQG